MRITFIPTLEDIFGQMQMAADAGVAAGFIVFSDTNDSTMGSGPHPGSRGKRDPAVT